MDRAEKLRLAREKLTKFQQKKAKESEPVAVVEPTPEPSVAPVEVIAPPVIPSQNGRKTPSPQLTRLPSPEPLQDFMNHPFNQDIVPAIQPIELSTGLQEPQHTEQYQGQSEFHSLEEQCQYYSDMYQQISEQYNTLAQELHFCKDTLSNLQLEFGDLNAQNGELMHTCTERENEINALKAEIHKLQVEKAEIIHQKDQEIDSIKKATVTAPDDIDVEEIVRIRMKNALLDFDTQAAQLKERKQWCRNEEDRLQEWEEVLQKEKNRLMELESSLEQKASVLQKREEKVDELSFSLKEQHEKLTQGQEWVRMEEEELVEKQRMDYANFEARQKELNDKESELIQRQEHLHAMQAQLNQQHSQFDHERLEFQMKEQVEQQAHNSLELDGMTPNATFDPTKVHMPPEEVKQWIDYYNTKCAELDLTQQELVIEKESYAQLSAQLQEQLETFKHHHHSDLESREIALESRVIALEKREAELENRARQEAFVPNNGVNMNELVGQIQQLKLVIEKESKPNSVLEERIINLESTNQQLMAYLSTINQKLDTHSSTPADFCTAITELSRYSILTRTNNHLLHYITKQEPVERKVVYEIPGLSEHSKSILTHVNPDTDAVRELVRSRLYGSRGK